MKGGVIPIFVLLHKEVSCQPYTTAALIPGQQYPVPTEPKAVNGFIILEISLEIGELYFV